MKVNPRSLWLETSVPLPTQVGRYYLVTGHWAPDFIGELTYAGKELALLEDEQGIEHEICYLQNVEFRLLP